VPGDDPADAELVPVPAGVPWPSVPALPAGDPPPVSTVLLAWMIAWRKGCTPSETLAMTAIPARTATGRSQPAAAGPLAPSGPRAADGNRRSSRGSAAGQVSAAGQAQWPRQVQFLTHSYAPLMMLSSQGRGGRLLILARMRSSPSSPGSTGPTAACRA
jgi:hypothetical protein